MRQLILNQFEKIGFADLNNIQLGLHRSFYDDLLYQLFQGRNGVLNSSFAPVYTGALTLTLAAGTGFYYDSSQSGYSPRYRELLAATTIPVTLGAASVVNPRIDLVCLTPSTTIGTQNRYVKTGGTGPITLTSVNKDLVDAYTLTVVAGTPAGSPTAPATPAGSLAIAQCLVSTSTGMSGQVAITDLRQPLMPSLPAAALAGEALTAGQLAYLVANPAAGVDAARTVGAAYKVDVGVTNGALRYASIGVVAATVSSGAGVALITSGPAYGFSGLTPGAVYYADPTTPGGLTKTKPSTVNQWIVPIGIAISSTVMLIDSALTALAAAVALPVGVGLGAGGVLALTAASSPYTVTTNNNGQVFLIDSSAGAFTFNLPAPVSNLKFTVKDVTGSFGTNNAILHRAAAEKIENLASDFNCDAAYGEYAVICDGTNWWRI
jgi:hypothetical protein